jgi:ribosome-associated protein
MATSADVETDPRSARRERALSFCTEAARLCADLKCRDVKVLDVTGKSPVTDFMILATGASPRQMRSVVDQVEDLGKEHDLHAINPTKRSEGGERWTAIDLVDVVVHVFSEEARLFYDLDSLWGDAPEVRWFDGSADAASEGPSQDLPTAAADFHAQPRPE